MTSIQPKSNKRLEQVGKVSTDQTNQVLHLKGLFVSQNRTNPHIPDRYHKYPGFYKKPCKRCGSVLTTKHGKLLNKYQRCDSCEQLLNIPSNAKRLGMITTECLSCRKANDIKYLPRWHCTECGLSFLECSTREWPLKNQQRDLPLKAYGTWPKIKEMIRERDDYRCQVCGKTNGKLDVHHIIPRRDGGQDSMDNLITVCDGCHKKIEPIRKRFIISITGDTYCRARNLVSNARNDEELIIRLCEELEKRL